MYHQHKRDEERKERFRKLRQLSDDGKVILYFKTYAEYLEWDNIISTDRIALHKMCLQVVKELES